MREAGIWSRPAIILAVAHVVLIELSMPFVEGQSTFSLWSVQDRPTLGLESDGKSYGGPFPISQKKAHPPIEVKGKQLSSFGYDPAYDTSVSFSKYTHVGCYLADLTFTQDQAVGSNYDPNECLAKCKSIHANRSDYEIIAMVYEERCGCTLTMADLAPAASSLCNKYCKYYQTPICGGPPNYWGVFREYDYQALTSQGAYDPWRYIWYSIVVIKHQTLIGGYQILDTQLPERYFLHAVETNNGKAQFQFQMEVTGLFYGLQYDIDSSRLVALHTKATTGRMWRFGQPLVNWDYKLAIININTTEETKPEMVLELKEIQVPQQENISFYYLAISGASAILSLQDCFLFTQSAQANSKREMKDRLYIVRIKDGYIINQETTQSVLDFKILQLFANEKYGDITAIGPRLPILLGEQSTTPKQTYVYIARVDYDHEDERHVIQWTYNPNNPEILTSSVDVTADLRLYPGVNANDHLKNLSAIVYATTPPSAPDERAITILEVNYRTKQSLKWCNETDTLPCFGSVNYKVPYAKMYNAEPGIPLSLKAPQLLYANFTMEANSIIVDWDRATTRGALQVDENNDMVPDYIDESTIPLGNFDCAQVFSVETIHLLGPFGTNNNGTYCVWNSDTRIIIYLPRVINVSVGDQLFVKTNTIAAKPYGGEYSPFAVGGTQVRPPFPTLDPVIILQGSLTVDSCTDVSLDAVSSFNDGGAPEYHWELVPGTTEDPNPLDKTNSPFRVFNTTKIDGIVSYTTSMDNTPLFKLSPEFLESAAEYKFTLTLTSRWKRSTVKPFKIVKLSFSAPMVTIKSEALVPAKRPASINIEAVGKPSGCVGADTKLGYRWECTSNNFDFSEKPDIVTTSSILFLPPMTLLPPTEEQRISTGIDYIDYNFTINCYVDAPGGDVPERTATQTVTVRITQSDVYVVFQTGSRVITKGDILVLDARPSQDPDFPTTAGHAFKGVFIWKCLEPPDPVTRLPCFPTPLGKTADGTIYELIDQEQFYTCRQDIGNKISDGGVTFYAPLFDDKPFCQYARGVVMFQTNNFTEGEYKFNVRVSTFQGLRSATEDVMITVSAVRVPKISVYVLDPKEKYPVTNQIRLQGNEEGNAYNTTQTKRFYWNIFQQEENPAQSSAGNTNNPNNPTVQDQYVWVNRTDELNPTDSGKFDYDPTIPKLLVRENVLQDMNTYAFRLIIHLMPADVSGYGEVIIHTAGGRPRNGKITLTPLNGSMDVERTMSATDWTANDIPLWYAWGILSIVGGQNVKIPITPMSVTTTYVADSMQMGSAANNYSLILYCDITTKYGAIYTATLQFQSTPPANSSKAQGEILDQAKEADGSNVLNLVDSALSIDPGNPQVWNEIFEIIDSKDIPQSEHELAKEMNLYATMVANNNTSEELMSHLEALIVVVRDRNCVAVDPNSPCASVPTRAFQAIGGLYPYAQNNGNGRRLLSRTRGRSLMRKYQRVNEDFTFRHQDENDRYLAVDGENSLVPSYPITIESRQLENHPEPNWETRVVQECRTPFCDRVGIVCYTGKRTPVQVCCDESNPDSLCNDPPCWFVGLECPEQTSRALWSPQTSEIQEKEEMDSDSSDTWFDQWNAYNFPSEEVNSRSLSDSDRAHAFHAWHPNIYKRRLMYATHDASKSEAQMLTEMDKNEAIELAAVRNMVRNADNTNVADLKKDANQEVALDAGDPALAAMLKAEAERKRIEAANHKLEFDRNQSQRITRLAVMRDTLAKSIIEQISTSELQTYTSVSFTLVIGKTTNLSKIHPAFIFPPAFQVPADSPDYPTATNPVTGFSFEYVHYVQNVYQWSESNPISTQNQLMTLVVLKASTDDLDIHAMTDQPIRVFTDLLLFSNALCLWWDRFAKNTAGGAWSTQGVSNDGTACITTNLSDIGVFMDGRVPEGYDLIDKATDWQREMWETRCVGCGDTQNQFVIAVLGMILFGHILLILLGYVMDETRRSDMAKQKLNSRYHYDGDGLTGPLNVDDAIAYQYSDRLVMLGLGTTWKVLKREHALVSPIWYHEVFTRPQRMLCFAALVLGLMAMNATVQSRRGFMLAKGSTSEYIMSGVLSGLLTFPIYCGLVMMFSMRPMPVKKRLIKRSYNRREVDLIAQKRQELDHASNLMPPPGYLQLPPPPPGGIPHPPGQTNLLGAPPPLPLPPLPYAAPGGAGSLPALPPPSTGIGSLPGIPALPSILGQPPPPNYPPSALGAKGPPAIQALPPRPQDFKRGRPPPNTPQLADYPETHPIPATMIANTPNVVSGNTLTALENGATGETGGTSQRPLTLVDAQMDSTGQNPTTPQGTRLPEPTTPPLQAHPLGLDTEQELLPPPSLVKDQDHQMMQTHDTIEGSETGSTIGTGMILKTPRGGMMEIPSDLQVNTAYIRGQPNQALPPPSFPAPTGPGGITMPSMPPGIKPPPGLPPTYKKPEGPGLMPPPPPPPPKEDGDAFIRRIRLTYMDKVIKEHEKYDLLEDHAETGREVKQWVFSALTIAPYGASCCVILSAMFIILNYGVKFSDDQAKHWIYGSLLGLSLVLLLLELFRVMMMTLVELRKFENRKKSKAGHFLPRRVKREDDKHYNEAPKPKVWMNATKAPQVPISHVPNLPPPGGRPELPGMTPGMRVPILSAPLPKARLPAVAPPPPPGGPPPKPKAMMDFSSLGSQFVSGSVGNLEKLQPGFEGGRITPPGGGTPTSMSGTGKLGLTPPGMPNMSTTTPEQTLDRSASSHMTRSAPPKGMPTAPGSVSGMTPKPVDMPPPPTGVSPTHSGPPSNRSSRSLGALRKQQQAALSEQVKAGIQRHETPPPPPGANSRPQSAGSSPPPPPGGPPIGGRKRPTSASKSSSVSPAPQLP